MRYYLWTFVGLMFVASSGCSKPIEPIEVDITITNDCPGNMLQDDVNYEFTYMKFITDDPPFSDIKIVKGMVGRDGFRFEKIKDGADLNGDGALDYSDLDGTPSDTEVLYMTLDYLDADNDPNSTWVASAGTILGGATVVVTIDEYCVPTYEIQNPELAGICGSSTQSGVFRRVDSTLCLEK